MEYLIHVTHFCLTVTQLEQYRPSDDERTLYPDRLWYFDHPDLFPNEAYLLTNDLGASSAYLVEASNTTHWELQGHSLDPSSKFSNLEKRQTVHYINSYHEGGCIPNTFVGQAQNPPNGFCQRWYVWRVKSLFVVGDGNFQVNFYWGDAQSCSRNFLGGVRAYSGCWTTPNSDQLPWEFWPCYTC
ncbi:hypothetical protein BJY04DRAFT_134129 [Aspergillus karnatakaensis]|uniref:uncharacterized protein n=1 Tax=Aspergillus karnatakaensis TaxID=1810916 RepID=UPI003CCD6CC2